MPRAPAAGPAGPPGDEDNDPAGPGVTARGPGWLTPRRLLWLGALGLLLGALVLHREVLFGGAVYHMDDAADGYYPSHVAIARAYRAGELPTWERGAWSGFPLLADPYYGAFYPGSLTFYLFGMVRGLGVNIVLHTLLGAAGMLLLLRRRGLSVGPAVLGAAALGLSTFMVERIRHIIFPQMMAWVPWCLAFVEGYLRTGRRRELLLLAASLGLLLVCGAMPLLPFLALGLLAYVLPRALAGPGAWARLGPLLALGLAAGCGALLAMAQIVPTLAHLPESPRQLGADYAFASSYAWPDYRYAALLLFPDLFGGADRGRWLGAYNHWELAGWYVGLLPVLLAPLALLRRRGRPELIGLLVVALLGVGLAFGDAAPLHRFAFRHVPIYAALRCPARALVLFLLAAPILGAEGLEAALGRLGGRGARRWLGLAAAAGLLIAGAALFYYLKRPAPRLTALSQAMRAAVADGVPVLAAGLAVLVALRLGALSRQAAGLLLGLLAVADVVAAGRGYVQPRPADFAAGTERFAAVDWLLDAAERERRAGRPHELGRFAIDPQGPFRLHNLGLTYDLEGVGGYDSYSIWRYVQYLHVLNTGAPYPYKQLRHDPAAGDVKRFDSPLLDLLNVRWYIGQRAPAPGWIERFRPAPGAPLHARYEPIWDPLLAVYENPHPLPRAFVVYGARVVRGAEAQARALATLDPRREALLEETPAPLPEAGLATGPAAPAAAPRPAGPAAPAATPAGPSPTNGRPLTPARLLVAERHRLVIEAEAAAPGILVVGEAHYPGWSAKVDGQPAPLLRADYALRGVALPAGRHTVEMRFVSRPTRLGLLLSALGLLCLPLLGLLRRRRA